jgi:hypothetical protein
VDKQKLKRRIEGYTFAFLVFALLSITILLACRQVELAGKLTASASLLCVTAWAVWAFLDLW